MRRFHSLVLATACRGVAFVSGALVAVLVLVAALDDDAFLFHGAPVPLHRAVGVLLFSVCAWGSKTFNS